MVLARRGGKCRHLEESDVHPFCAFTRDKDESGSVVVWRGAYGNSEFCVGSVLPGAIRRGNCGDWASERESMGGADIWWGTSDDFES